MLKVTLNLEWLLAMNIPGGAERTNPDLGFRDASYDSQKGKTKLNQRARIDDEGFEIVTRSFKREERKTRKKGQLSHGQVDII